MQESITKFKNITIENFSRESFTYHEWMVNYHLKIVEHIALELCDIYTEADRNIVQALVWFHDFGAKIVQQIETKPWGWKEAIIADADGNEFIIEQEI
ncbi:hypothetical protein EXS61_00355 [Candidatus Parcubacteria bacterium]|nr:hypothetical protein [Candidatus Parcubacteria bacterium]